MRDAIDEFWVGYSSLVRLVGLPADIVKVVRCLRERGCDLAQG